MFALDFTSTSLVPLSSSLDLREKLFKCVVFACKLGAARSPKLATVAEQVASARKIFLLLHWCKYADDAREVLREPAGRFRSAALLETTLATAVDALVDVSTLCNLGVLGLPAPRRKQLEWTADAIDAVYSLLALLVGSVRAARKADALATAPPHKKAAAEQKLALQRLALVKYCMDFLKASYGAGFRGLHGTGVPKNVALVAGFASGALSTHKWAVKLLPSRV